MSKAEHMFVVGSSSLLAPAIAELYGADKTTFMGRLNPHELDNWHASQSFETERGISLGRMLLATLLTETPAERNHLVLLQGVSSSEWESSTNVNLISASTLAEEFCDTNKRRGSLGSIALIGSASAYLGGKLPYAATKAALTGIMNGLNREYGEHTRTNMIVPGAFEGGMTASWSEERRKSILAKTHAKRMATALEIADSIVFCARNQYVCGTVINMSSGQICIQ